MRRNLIITVLLGVLALLAPLHATVLELSISPIAPTDSIDLPMSLTSDIDSILNHWHARNFMMTDPNCEEFSVNPVYDDSIYIERLAQLPVIMEMPYNAVVRSFIDRYVERSRKKVAYMLGASNFYIPIFEEALDAYNLPMELKYLPVIESALDPVAVSPAGAVGLWQFMLATGKQYGLESNSLVDDRRDPIKSSWAAARYLRDLYGIFGDWNLVIAAYNCGPQNVNKAIHRAGGVKDYWQIYNYLPRETRGYVPAFIAANYAMNYYCEHGICPMEADLFFKSDTININRKLHFKQVEGTCHVPLDEIRALNPQYKNDIIPGGDQFYTLRLPIESINSFLDKPDSVYSYMAEVYLPYRKTVEVDGDVLYTQTAQTATKTASKTPARTPTTRTHKIKRGETLSQISARYGVTVNQLRQWNGIKGNNITAGKSIQIKK